MNYQVILTSKAEKQLFESALWWSLNRNAEQAVCWLNGFQNKLAVLVDHPEKQSLAPEDHLLDLPYTLRQVTYGTGSKPTHRALFEIREQTVFIVSIRHLAQQYLSAEEI